MGKPIPFAAREAHLYFELGVHPTWQELNRMPQELVDMIRLYHSVVNIIQYGGELTF